MQKLEKVKICTRCMQYVPVYTGCAESVEEVNTFSNVHYGHPVVFLPIKELDTRVYKRFR